MTDNDYGYDYFDQDDSEIQMLKRAREKERAGNFISVIESDELFDKQIAKRKYVISEIMPEGLLLLFGEPKVGKSFFVLDLCCKVAKGEPFLGYPTEKGEVLYFCFEDDEERLQKRMHSMCDEEFPGLFLTSDVLKTDDNLLFALEKFLNEHPNLKLVVIDTLTHIRSDKGGGNIYKKDYDDLYPILKFAHENHITILLVHHKNKKDEDGYNSISGSNGLAGVCDDIYELKRKDREKPYGELVLSGRDIIPLTIKLKQDENGIWHTIEDTDHLKQETDPVVIDTFLVISWNGEETGKYEYTATELSLLIKEILGHDIHPTQITKKLTVNHEDLRALGFSFVNSRTRETRLLKFTKEDTFRFPKRVVDESGMTLSKLVFVDDALLCDGSDGVTVENDMGKVDDQAVTETGSSGL